MLNHLLALAKQGLQNFAPAAPHSDADAARQVQELQAGLQGLAAELEVLKTMERERVTGCFEWMDGFLVQALESGDWVLLDNVNLCNPTVLDRLNPLLEPGGVLMVNERGLVNGQVTIIKPHPNFRLFLCMDPQRGEISRAMRNRGVEVCLLDSQLGSTDLMWLLCSLGLPGRELPRVMIEHHHRLVAVSRQALGPVLTVRHLLKWARMLVATLPRGVPIAQAWPSATELVYSACGSSERWRRESAAASSEFLQQVPLRILDACPHEVTGFVNASLQQRNALHANILRDSMALQDLVRRGITSAIPVGAKGFDRAALSALQHKCLNLARVLDVSIPSHALQTSPSSQSPEDATRQAGNGGVHVLQSVQVAAHLFLSQTSPADWELRMAALEETASGLPEGEARHVLLAAKTALRELANHPALQMLMKTRRERALHLEEGSRGKKGAVPLVVDDMTLDLCDDAGLSAQTCDGVYKQQAHLHHELMAACDLVLQCAIRDALQEAHSSAAASATAPQRQGAAGRLQSQQGAKDESGGGLDDQVHQWLDALLMRLDACIAQWLQDAAATVAASASQAEPAKPHPAASTSVIKLLAKITAHRNDMVKHVQSRGREQDVSADARVGGGASWLSTMLVMWRWFLKDAAALMRESGVPIQIQSLKGVKKHRWQQDPPASDAAMSDVCGVPGFGIEWPNDVRGLLSHLDDSLPTWALQGTPLWLYGGHPKMLSTLELQRLAVAFERTCQPFGFAWCDMLDHSKASGAMVDDDDARRFPVALLCLDEEYRKTALEGHAALMCVNDPHDSAGLLQRLAEAPGWLQRDGKAAVDSALGREASHLVGADGCTPIPVPVSIVRFMAWKAALWPAIDHQCLLHELSLLSSIALSVLGADSASPAAPSGEGGSRKVSSVLRNLGGGHLSKDVSRYVSRYLADSSRSPLEFSAYQQLLWEIKRAAAQEEIGGSETAGMDMTRASGLLIEMMVRWHARTWNASFTRAADVAMAPVLPFDYRPSRRERERIKARAQEAAHQRGSVHVDTARLGPMLLRLPVKTLHAGLLSQRWDHTTISNRTDALQQMRRAASLHLLAVDEEDEAGLGRREWVLIGHLLAQFVGCHSHLLDADRWRLFRPRIMQICTLASGAAGELADAKDGADRLQDADQVLATCKDRRARDVLTSLIAPALRIMASALRAAAGNAEAETLEQQDLLAKGQVWGLLGAARVRLVLPESPVDPASKYAVKLRIVEDKISKLQAEKYARELQGSLSPGSLPDSATRTCEAEIDKLTRRAAVLRKKLVPRPCGDKAPTFEHLFGELQRFAATLTASPAKLSRLLCMAPGGSLSLTHSADERAALLEEERHMQDVAAQLCARLEGGEWQGFEDLTGPLALGVYELRLGLRLSASHLLLQSQGPLPAEEGGGAVTVAKLMEEPFAYSLSPDDRLLRHAHQLGVSAEPKTETMDGDGDAEDVSGGGEGAGGETDMAVLRAVLHAVCVSVAQEGRWSPAGAAALEVVTRAYGRLWSQRADRERARKAKEEESFAFRERKVEMKSEAELEEADYVSTFVDYSKEFADIEMRSGAQDDEDERRHVAKEADKVAADVADKRAEDKQARRDAASVINEDDLQLLYLAHLRLSAHMTVSQGVAAANSISKQLQESLRRVSPEALADAAAARYVAAAACVEPEILRLPARLDRTAAAAHLGNISHSLLALAAKSTPAAEAVGAEKEAAGDAGDEALAIDALGQAAAESMGGGDGRLLPSLLSGMRKDVMYRDGDACEAKLLCKPVAAFASRVQALLREFPDHAILEQLLLVSQRLLSLPLDSPLGRLLAGLELLHRKALSGSRTRQNMCPCAMSSWLSRPSS